MLDDAEVFRAHAKHCGAVHLGLPAYEVGLLRMQVLAFLVLPDLFGVIPVVEKNGGGVPVQLFLRHEGAALQYQDVLAGLGEMESEGSAAGSRADDNCVVVV